MNETTTAVSTETATKTLLESKTIIGIGIASLCTILQLFGVVDISSTEQATLLQEIMNLATAGVTIAGLGLAFYGRIKAKTQVVVALTKKTE